MSEPLFLGLKDYHDACNEQILSSSNQVNQGSDKFRLFFHPACNLIKKHVVIAYKYTNKGGLKEQKLSTFKK